MYNRQQWACFCVVLGRLWLLKKWSISIDFSGKHCGFDFDFLAPIMSTVYRSNWKKCLLSPLLDASLAYSRTWAYSFSVTNTQSARRKSCSASKVIDSPVSTPCRNQRVTATHVSDGRVPAWTKSLHGSHTDWADHLSADVVVCQQNHVPTCGDCCLSTPGRTSDVCHQRAYRPTARTPKC